MKYLKYYFFKSPHIQLLIVALTVWHEILDMSNNVTTRHMVNTIY